MAGCCAAMPLLEAKELLVHVFTRQQRRRRSLKVSFAAARQAYCHAKRLREADVELSPLEKTEPGKCALLDWCMYGTRDAAVV